MDYAARIRGVGSPDVFEWVPIDVGAPAAHEVLIGQHAIGVNPVDLYMRSGNHPAKLEFPATLGFEAAGVVEALGEGVTEFAPGDRVAYFGVLGAYAEARRVPVERLFKLPAHMAHGVAAACLIRGITARYLCREAYRVDGTDIVLVNGAAGGIGSFLTQWCAALGATVIGVVGHANKAEFAASRGCRHVIVTDAAGLKDRFDAIGGPLKASVAFDALGAQWTRAALDCLRPRGTLVVFGRAAGYPQAVTPFEHLMLKGSLRLMMTQLADFVASREERDLAWSEVCGVIASGKVRPTIGQQYSLADVRKAHEDMEARRTVGSTILRVD
jgi:NADPH2:quinone reductase